VPRLVVASLILLLLACGDSDRKSDASADVRADVSGDVSTDSPADVDLSADAGVDVSASVCPALGIDCSPFVCRNGTCLSSCSGDADCIAPAICQSGSCRNPAPQSCTSPAQCASGFCEQGACCDRACRSPCESCALPGSRGRCHPLPADAVCGPDAGGD
jgi:hypothetical protein